MPSICQGVPGLDKASCIVAEPWALAYGFGPQQDGAAALGSVRGYGYPSKEGTCGQRGGNAALLAGGKISPDPMLGIKLSGTEAILGKTVAHRLGRVAIP